MYLLESPQKYCKKSEAYTLLEIAFELKCLTKMLK